MKLDAMDYSRQDLADFVAAPHGLTLEHLLAREFPFADYRDDDGAEYWTYATVVRWLEAFHTSMHAMHQAADPAGFARFQEGLRRMLDDVAGEGAEADLLREMGIDAEGDAQ